MRNKVRKSEASALARDHTSNLGKAFCSTLYSEIGKKVPSKSSKLQTVRINYISEENGEKRQKDGDGEVEEKIPYPKSIFFILSMEACERFSYYGMRSKTSALLKLVTAPHSKG